MTFQDITHLDALQKDLEHLGRLLAGEKRTYSTEKRYLLDTGGEIISRAPAQPRPRTQRH